MAFTSLLPGQDNSAPSRAISAASGFVVSCGLGCLRLDSRNFIKSGGVHESSKSYAPRAIQALQKPSIPVGTPGNITYIGTLHLRDASAGSKPIRPVADR